MLIIRVTKDTLITPKVVPLYVTKLYSSTKKELVYLIDKYSKEIKGLTVGEKNASFLLHQNNSIDDYMNHLIYRIRRHVIQQNKWEITEQTTWKVFIDRVNQLCLREHKIMPLDNTCLQRIIKSTLSGEEYNNILTDWHEGGRIHLKRTIFDSVY